MRILPLLLGIVLIVGILWEGFETVIFSRRGIGIFSEEG